MILMAHYTLRLTTTQLTEGTRMDPTEGETPRKAPPGETKWTPETRDKPLNSIYRGLRRGFSPVNSYYKALKKGLNEGRINQERVTNKQASESEFKFESRTIRAYNEIIFSDSVQLMVKELGKDADVYAYQLVEYLFNSHPDYAGSDKKLTLDDKLLSQAEKMPVYRWLENVASLYILDKNSPLHGKLVILGLAVLDDDLGRELAREGFVNALKNSLVEKNFDSLLTPDAKKTWESIFGQHDTVRTLSDDPASATELDILGRKVFARGLVERILQIKHEEVPENGSFMIHIHGPWGSGKTSILNFMQHQLEEESHELDEANENVDEKGKEKEKRRQKWIVVRFNAWQNQRSGPSWWSLMDAVFKSGIRRLWKIAWWRCIPIFLWENIWRVWKGRSPIFWVLTVLAIVIGVTIYYNLFNVGTLISQNGSSTVAILTIIISLLTGLGAISTSLVPGSARAADQFVELSSDPMQRISGHFNRLIGMMGYPIAIFIDDLDRCNYTYTVEILERIQTLFRQAGVFFVVTADGQWLYSSYQKVYENFKPEIDEPGRPLGHLFLAKTFQLSIPLPRLSSDLQNQYWEYLLETNGKNKIDKSLDDAKKAAQDEFRGLSDQAILEKTEEKSDNPIQKQARKEVAVTELAKKKRKPHLEQFLKPYAKFLEPNPRAMKRLINTYSLMRDICILEEVKMDRQKLALWTILSMRWPLLSQYLERKPEKISFIMQNKKPRDKELDENMKKLFSNKDVIMIVQGLEAGGPLDADAIRNLTAHGSNVQVHN
jgi:KAP-like P-loop domain-containing protein